MIRVCILILSLTIEIMAQYIYIIPWLKKSFVVEVGITLVHHIVTFFLSNVSINVL